jgi:hypothetical protein
MTCKECDPTVGFWCKECSMEMRINELERQLRQATGCLALYLEATDMIAIQSCNKGTIKFLNSLEEE